MGRPVRVKLNSGIEYRGVLACLDGYLNIAMEQTEEYEGGQLKARYGDCFIRGNNGTLALRRECRPRERRPRYSSFLTSLSLRRICSLPVLYISTSQTKKR
jgi:U6 snRNA-associated Sm-like protein LSm6